MRTFMTPLAAGLVLLWAADASATGIVEPAPEVMVLVDGELVTLPSFDVNADGTHYLFDADTSGVGNGDFDLTLLSGEGDTDPMLTYGISVTDFGAPTTFTFMFTLPIIATGPSLSVSASMSATVTDGGDGVVGIAPVAPETTLQQSFVSPDAGFTLVNAGVDVGPGSAAIPLTGIPGSGLHGPFASGPLAGPAITADFLKITLAFTGTGDGDVYTINGGMVVNAVPEPGTLSLLAVGLGGALVARRRVRR
jgi:hypothetical protein